MANQTPQELAQSVNDLSRVELRKFNHYSNVQISEQELGANMTIQDLASDVSALTGGDRTTFETELNSLSGGEKKSHYPC